MKKKYLWPGILIVIILIAWAIFGAKDTKSTTIYVTPKKGVFKVNATTTGELRAKNSTDILGPRAIREVGVGRVEIMQIVPEGTVVQKGDFVAELDRSEITATLQKAMLELDQTESKVISARLDSSISLSKARNEIVNLKYSMEEAQLKKEQSRYESEAVQRQRQIDYEQAERHYEQAKQNYKKQVKKAEAELTQVESELKEEKNKVQKIRELMEQFTVRAPEAGMVIYRRDRRGRKQTEGSSISAWNPVVAELPDFSIMESVTYVNEVDIQQIKKGQSVDISLDAMPDKDLTGVVTDVSNVGAQRPGSSAKVYEVVIEIQQQDSTLRPAMTTSNVIHINSIPGVTYLPLETVHARDSLSFVYINKKGRPVMHQVLLGAINKNYAIIKDGIELNDKVYLSVPDDTSGIKKIFLPDEVVQQYREKAERDKQKKADSKKNRKTNDVDKRQKFMKRMKQRKQNNNRQ